MLIPLNQDGMPSSDRAKLKKGVCVMNDYQSKIIKPKRGLLELAKQLGNVLQGNILQACKVMVYSSVRSSILVQPGLCISRIISYDKQVFQTT